jgi:hypothetical protein
MGHSRGGDVHSIYTHVELPTLQDAISRLGAWHAEKIRALQSTGEATAPPQDNNPTPQTEQQTDDRNQSSPMAK